jgi:hypothetical protein
MTTSFTLLTDTPGRLRTRLIERGIIETYTDGRTGQQMLKGVRPGVEWVEVPNPIVVTPAVGDPGTQNNPNPDYVPAVMDPRHVYLVKVTHDAEDDQMDGMPPGMTKLKQWIIDNSTADTITSADGRSWAARNINDNFWLIPDTADFGVWQ